MSDIKYLAIVILGALAFVGMMEWASHQQDASLSPVVQGPSYSVPTKTQPKPVVKPEPKPNSPESRDAALVENQFKVYSVAEFSTLANGLNRPKFGAEVRVRGRLTYISGLWYPDVGNPYATFAIVDLRQDVGAMWCTCSFREWIRLDPEEYLGKVIIVGGRFDSRTGWLFGCHGTR